MTVQSQRVKKKECLSLCSSSQLQLTNRFLPSVPTSSLCATPPPLCRTPAAQLWQPRPPLWGQIQGVSCTVCQQLLYVGTSCFCSSSPLYPVTASLWPWLSGLAHAQPSLAFLLKIKTITTVTRPHE